MNLKLRAIEAANKLHLLDLYTSFRCRITGAHIAILNYHRVGSSKDSWSMTPLSEKAFDQQMAYLSKKYEIVSLEYLADALTKHKHLSNNQLVVITFDDGYQDNYIYAYPVLKKYGVPATIFLTSGFIGADKLFWWDQVSYMIAFTPLNAINVSGLGEFDLSLPVQRKQTAAIIKEKLKKCAEAEKNDLISRMVKQLKVEVPAELGSKMALSWSQVREMAGNGIDFGAHTDSHPILTNLPLDEAKQEIVISKKIIEAHIGKPISSFAYPNGNYNRKIASFLRNNGFKCAVTVQNKIAGLTQNVYELPRINGTIENFNKFKTVFSGLYLDLC